MKRLQKNTFLMAFAIASIASNGPRPAYAADTDIVAHQGGGIYNNVDVFRIDSNANVKLSTYNVSGVAQPHTTISNQGVFTLTNNLNISAPADQYYGSLTSAVSTTTTSGSSQGTIFTAFLASGSANVAAIEGSAICSTTSQQGNLVTAVVCGAGGAILNQKSFIGLAVAAASTGTVVNIYDRGWVLALTTGTVVPGDQLITSSLSAGFLETATTVASTSTVAIALGQGNSAGATTKVRIIR